MNFHIQIIIIIIPMKHYYHMEYHRYHYLYYGFITS